MNDLKHKILTAVEADLEAIEDALAEHLNPHFDLVRQVAGHILFSGGKRLRPLLMVLAARISGAMDHSTYKFSVIFEYLHAATLLHDDVVDGGELRRGAVAAHQKWNPPKAVLTGDFLLARALSLAAEAGSAEVIATIAAITEQMSQGEIEQLARIGDLTLDEPQYLEVIRCKTAVLFQGACRTGGLICNAPVKQVGALADYGHHLGMAFQMADDLLDYSLDSKALGKKVGADLREGKMTLPVIYSLQRVSPADRQWISDLIQAREFEPSQFERLIELLHQGGGIHHTRQSAEAQVASAIAAIGIFADGEAKDLLTDIAAYALVRTA